MRSFLSHTIHTLPKSVGKTGLNPLHSSSRIFFTPLLLSRSFSTSANQLKTKFSPNLTTGSKVVIPVSMGRYHLSEKHKTEYDNILTALFRDTAKLLDKGKIARVDVISTADLQGINWDKKTVNEVESHFFETHEKSLTELSNCYKWWDWINKEGSDLFEDHYQRIAQDSRAGSEWYNLMVKTHESVKMSSDLEKSLEYQRREYAAVMLMSGYNNLVYTGPISIAWSYMYHIYPYEKLPVFTRATFEKNQNNDNLISAADASHTVRIILAMIEQTLTSPNFPKKEKQKLVEMGMSLFYAYEPKNPKLVEAYKKNMETITSTLNK